MEFKEMQSIWGAQNSAAAYNFDEEELHRRILARKNRALSIANISELMIIGVYVGAGVFIWVVKMYLLAGWLFLVALVLVISRIRRLIAARRFDRSVQGELQHALATAKYQVRLSRLMRWNIVPIGVLSVLAIGQGGKPLWAMALVLLFFAASYYGAGFENKKYVRQRESLEALQRSLNG
ncbi:MAG: hypothetical protein J0H74_21390 [Chitinophagaceae bacterium]|nr:hypothetical protein [Chitinophagaceae bacterium]